MLVDHADAGLDCIFGRIKTDGSPVCQDAALVLRQAINADRDWTSWLRDDRRARYADVCRLRCYEQGGRIWYAKEDVRDFINNVNSGRVDPTHPQVMRTTSHREVEIRQSRRKDGADLAKIVTGGQAFTKPELKTIIHRLVDHYKVMDSPQAI